MSEKRPRKQRTVLTFFTPYIHIQQQTNYQLTMVLIVADRVTIGKYAAVNVKANAQKQMHNDNNP